MSIGSHPEKTVKTSHLRVVIHFEFGRQKTERENRLDIRTRMAGGDLNQAKEI